MSRNNNQNNANNPEHPEDEFLEEYDLDDDNMNEYEDELDDEPNPDDSADAEDESDLYKDYIAVLNGHDQAVLCCDLSHDDKFAVSGGQDDKAVVWDVATTVSKEITGFTDSVVAAKFNCNSTLLALADMSGNIKVLEANTWVEKFTYEVGDVNWLLWHPVADNVLLVGTDSGEAWMWKLSDKSEQFKIFPSNGHSNTVSKIFNDGKRIAMGYNDGSVQIFDLKEATVLHSLTGSQAHTGTVVSLDLNSDNTLLATGSVDSTVKIINTSNFKVLFSIDCTPKEKEDADETTNSIEALVFSGKNLLAVGGLDGMLEIWDVSAKIKRNEMRFDSGIFKMLPDKNNSSRIFIGTLSSIYVMDVRDCSIIDSKTGGKNELLDFAISSDSNFLITSSERFLGVCSFEKY